MNLVNTNELRAAMVRKGKTTTDLAKMLNITRDMVCKKIRGESGFTANQIVLVAHCLDLSLEMVNVIFFAGLLPTCLE